MGKMQQRAQTELFTGAPYNNVSGKNKKIGIADFKEVPKQKSQAITWLFKDL